ncbi:hypothetical protein C5748_13085 [Phyllobacterium phragmitis]|uniref:Uncharacterized protein n=1 Tax=Phyllobacterium phragmitis TaxID=2670329 RepID=A0A2S9IRH7_9HYPH|nr:hypothetical protein [Phyllobacterium phragmitis]PRD43134.1 hypothetical protein C5748_13085 [Phyllobacterium phragmitis]
MKKLLQLVILAIVVGWLVNRFGGDDDTSPVQSTATNSETNVSTAVSVPKACGNGGRVVDDIVAVTGEYEPRATPEQDGAKIKNVKASEALGKTHYHQIDSSTTVRRLCDHGNWTEVRIVTPEWLTHVQGWVPTKVLRVIERTAAGGRVYVEDDFFWDDDTSKFKPEIVAVVNQIAREHDGCSTIDTGTVAKSPSRSKPGDPVFFVTCGSSQPFNVWFRPGDAKKTFKPVAAISQGDAVLACEKAAKAAATHPSTVDFSRFLDVAYSARPVGRVSLDSTFTAKNAFNFELKYRIRCLFDGSTLIESQIVESD